MGESFVGPSNTFPAMRTEYESCKCRIFGGIFDEDLQIYVCTCSLMSFDIESGVKLFEGYQFWLIGGLLA